MDDEVDKTLFDFDDEIDKLSDVEERYKIIPGDMLAMKAKNKQEALDEEKTKREMQAQKLIE